MDNGGRIDNPVFSLSLDEENYVRGIDGYRRVALSIPSLSISLATALLAFEIYYLQHFYRPREGVFVEDFIVLLPMIAGCLFLVCAAFALDWVVDSFSDAELRALNTMHLRSDGEDHRMYSSERRGFHSRRRLSSGAYFIFVFCLCALFFLLMAALPIFLRDGSIDSVARSGMVAGGAYFAILLGVKMMTNNLPRRTWFSLIGVALVFAAGVLWSIGTLLKFF